MRKNFGLSIVSLRIAGRWMAFSLSTALGAPSPACTSWRKLMGAAVRQKTHREARFVPDNKFRAGRSDIRRVVEDGTVCLGAYPGDQLFAGRRGVRAARTRQLFDDQRFIPVTARFDEPVDRSPLASDQARWARKVRRHRPHIGATGRLRPGRAASSCSRTRPPCELRRYPIRDEEHSDASRLEVRSDLGPERLPDRDRKAEARPARKTSPI